MTVYQGSALSPKPTAIIVIFVPRNTSQLCHQQCAGIQDRVWAGNIFEICDII